jgi:hypothetical protein
MIKVLINIALRRNPSIIDGRQRRNSEINGAAEAMADFSRVTGFDLRV